MTQIELTTDDAPRTGVRHQRQIAEALPHADVSRVRIPITRTGGGEHLLRPGATHQSGRPNRMTGASPAPPHPAAQPAPPAPFGPRPRTARPLCRSTARARTARGQGVARHTRCLHRLLKPTNSLGVKLMKTYFHGRPCFIAL